MRLHFWPSSGHNGTKWTHVPECFAFHCAIWSCSIGHCQCTSDQAADLNYWSADVVFIRNCVCVMLLQFTVDWSCFCQTTTVPETCLFMCENLSTLPRTRITIIGRCSCWCSTTLFHSTFTNPPSVIDSFLMDCSSILHALRTVSVQIGLNFYICYSTPLFASLFARILCLLRSTKPHFHTFLTLSRSHNISWYVYSMQEDFFLVFVIIFNLVLTVHVD